MRRRLVRFFIAMASITTVAGGCRMAAQMVDGWMGQNDPAGPSMSAQESVIEAARSSPSERIQAQGAAAESAWR